MGGVVGGGVVGVGGGACGAGESSPRLGGVSVSSDAAGELRVSWDAPEREAFEYRVRWAREDLGYLSYWQPNEAGRGNEWPAGDATSVTLRGLDEGAVYKVTLRARFHDAGGGVSASPWTPEASAAVLSSSAAGSERVEAPVAAQQRQAGQEPHSAEESQREAGSADQQADHRQAEPRSDTPADADSTPAAPSLTGIALSPEGHVLLLWQAPGGGTAGGYRVLRGADPASLQAVAEVTGSTATSYTDAAAPAGATLHYAVQARNAAGLSEPSDTLSITTPGAPQTETEDQQPEQEEPETAESSHLTTFLSNTESDDAIAANLTDNTTRLAQSFRTGAIPTGYLLHSVTLVLNSFRQNLTIRPEIWTGEGQPETRVHELEISPVTTPSTDEVTYNAAAPLALEPNTTYWAVLIRTAGTGQVVGVADSHAAALPGWSFVGNALRYTDSWGPRMRRLKLRMSGEFTDPYVEPDDGDFPGDDRRYGDVTGLVSLGQTSYGHLSGSDVGCRGLPRRDDRRVCYGAAGDLWRLDVPAGGYYRVEAVFGDSPGVDTGGMVSVRFLRPGDGDLSGLGSAVDHNREDGRSVVHVKTDWRRHYVNVDAKDVNPDNPRTSADDHLSVEYEGDYTITVTDITGVAEVTDNVYHDRPGDDYSSHSLLSTEELAEDVDFAQQFTTGSHSGGYRLDRVEAQFHLVSPSTAAAPAIAIHADSSDAPSATKTCDLQRPVAIREHTRVSGGAVTRPSQTDGPLPKSHTFLAAAGCNLAADTKYHLVFSDLPANSFRLELNSKAAQDDPTAEGWSIGDGLSIRGSSATDWRSQSNRNVKIKLWAAPR
ncbi:choice-of-anchor R domain-containing protein [Candidatus Poriferisodalis sp.]|uniref:choice-of-anchor R domain-containing protein n=1 Tax=Candidatus Poriferisodalis sp. TaxID=3101277 RepID=UPI003B016C25